MSDALPLEIDVATLATMQKNGDDFLLLDVRRQEEYDAAKIDGCVLIPMDELKQRIDELESYRERLIVVQCHHGVRSLRVTHGLRQIGFSKAQSLAGGIDQWSQQIDPSVPRY